MADVDADKLVEYIDSYVKYMHKLIDTIVDNYTSLFKGEANSDSDEASGYRTPSDEEMQNFHNLFEECLQYASNATAKVQKKLASVLNSVQA